MENEYIIIITSEHCQDASYMDVFNCPLAKAIKEQIENVPRFSVGGDRVSFYIPTEDYLNYRFSSMDWNISVMNQLQQNKISQVELKITQTEYGRF